MFSWLVVQFALAVACTWAAIGYAHYRQLLDHPGERRSHVRATPRGGGVGIVVAVLIGAGWLALDMPIWRGSLAFVMLGLILVACIGWWDDHKSLSPWPRLLVHAIAAGLLAQVAWHANHSLWLAIATFVTVVVLTNIWNFMDGINGIATVQAAIVALMSMFLPYSEGVWIALALFVACMGFLPFNFPKAKIFLGDVGSGALGYVIAAMMLFAALRSASASIVMLLPLMPFVIDASFTLAWRMLHGERWWMPHVEHAYQRLARRFGHVRVTLGYAAIGLLGVGIGTFAVGWISRKDWILLAVWYALGAASWFVVRSHTQVGNPKED